MPTQSMSVNRESSQYIGQMALMVGMKILDRGVDIHKIGLIGIVPVAGAM